MKRVLLNLAILLLIFSGCSQKSYFKPQKIDRSLGYKLDLAQKIYDVSRDGLTYKDGSVVTNKRGMLKYKIPAQSRFVYDAKNAILVADKLGNVAIIKDGKTLFKHTFDTAISSGSIEGKMLAVVLANNLLILYDTVANKEVYREELEPTFAQDARIANPIFVKNLVIFPTLDGRLLVFDQKSKRVIKDLALSSKELFNNVIFLKELNNVVVAATRYKVISVSPNSLMTKRVDLKDLVYDGRNIFIFTNGGEIIKCDLNLKTIKTKKFKNAIFSAVGYADKIYAVEKSGYVLVLDKNLDNLHIIKLPSKIDKPIFIFRNKLFFDRFFIDLK